MDNPPERIYHWLDSQFSIARFYGGMKFNGHHYTIAYDEECQPLVRDDVLKHEAKEARMKAKVEKAKAKAAQDNLFGGNV